jgi:ATP-binding cassette, subfamily D (ALD), peroxisomal long-chain fatty acid import protein
VFLTLHRSYRELLELAGLTTRLYTLLSTLHQLPTLPEPDSITTDTVVLRNVDVGIPKVALSEDGEDRAPIQPPLVRDLSLSLARGEHL